MSAGKEKTGTSPEEKATEILQTLRSLADPDAVEGMARYGINPQNTLGISTPILSLAHRCFYAHINR